MSGRAHRILHLARRFFGSYSPVPLAARDREWVEAHLTAPETTLWRRMHRADRKHAAQVARTCSELLEGAPREVVAAAVLHDVGKLAVAFGPVMRAVSTVLAVVLGRERVGAWAGDLDGATHLSGPSPASASASIKVRIGRYVRHDEIGGLLLASTDSAPLTAAWAREHHRPPEHWTVPRPVGDALAAADDD